MTGRRKFLALSGLVLGAGVSAGWPALAEGINKSKESAEVQARLSALEASVGGRLGVSILDTGSGRQWTYRAAERFAMCSTFKLLVAAALLQRVDTGSEHLERRIVYRRNMLLSYSPATGKHVGGNGLSLAQLCEAMVTLSDNTATNLVLDSLGGLAPLNAFIRSLGDTVTRLDRYEPSLNSAVPGDLRDTTTPAAMTANLHKLLLSDALSAASRQQLIAWLRANQTGDKRVRAGVPADWKVGDKTGTGDYGSTNTVAIIWPPQRPPLLASLYLTETRAPRAQREAVLAKIGHMISEM